jgi:SMC interacting uncharacterized protein involved in chromosome segregation
MPRAAVKVLPAEIKTRWTLSRNDDDLHTPQGDAWAKMAANGFYFDSNRDQSLPRYESYDGSQYSSHTPRMSAQGVYQTPESVSNYDGFDFAMPLDDRRSQRISVNTKVRPQHHQNQDVVSKHLLYETALMDSQTFEILDIAEVDALKKEHVRLNSRIEAAQRKLTLESKVRDAAQNLQRLYSTNKRPDTPQSPESPKKNRRSLMPGRERSPSRSSLNAETAGQADSELQASVKKVDELHEQVKSLLDRRQYVERKLLRHTAAVLAEEANKNVESAVPGLANGHHGFGDDGDDAYTPNEFDGIRDILRGMPAGASNKVQQHEQQLASMQERLERLNSQLRSVISEADQTLGNKIGAERPLDQSEDSSVRVENRFARLEDSVHTLEQQHHDLQSHHAETKQGVQSQLLQTQAEVEQQLNDLNTTLHKAILIASEAQPVPGLQEPPQISGQGCYESQIEYMEESLMTMEQLVQQQGQSLSNSVGLSKKLEEYDNTISGLWDILQSDVAASPKPAFQEDEDDLPPTPRTPFIESFSLQAFSSRVRNLFDRAQAAKEQQDILRRQIQQQRELNEKSDVEKDRQIADLTTNHDTLSQEHSAIQQELANYIVKHEQIESEAGHSRNELQNVMNELEVMKKTMDAKQLEREESAKKMREHIELMQKQVSEAAERQKEMEKLESEVVRLTTELTMAKAELDGAYGTRAERKGAQAGHVAQLERELSEMTNEFQELTKESIELEKEREQLDALIDSLRDRCDSLESQLADEKLRSVGMRSPTTPGMEGKETTSMMVLRQEFKKMMREQRVEGLKLLRVSILLIDSG